MRRRQCIKLLSLEMPVFYSAGYQTLQGFHNEELYQGMKLNERGSGLQF